MATQTGRHDVDVRRERMPVGVRLAVLGAVGLVLAGSLYLIAVRGEALLLDLQAVAGRVFCF